MKSCFLFTKFTNGQPCYCWEVPSTVLIPAGGAAPGTHLTTTPKPKENFFLVPFNPRILLTISGGQFIFGDNPLPMNSALRLPYLFSANGPTVSQCPRRGTHLFNSFFYPSPLLSNYFPSFCDIFRRWERVSYSCNIK